jgi:hypothetical protein
VHIHADQDAELCANLSMMRLCYPSLPMVCRMTVVAFHTIGAVHSRCKRFGQSWRKQSNPVQAWHGDHHQCPWLLTFAPVKTLPGALAFEKFSTFCSSLRDGALEKFLCLEAVVAAGAFALACLNT